MPPPVDRTVARYLRAMIPVWFNIDTTVEVGKRPRPGLVSMREAAKQLGINYYSLRKVIQEGEGAGREFEIKIADLKFKGDRGELDKAARAWAQKNPPLAADEAPDSSQLLPELRDRVRARGRKRGLSEQVIEFACQARAYAGSNEITDDEIEELLDLAQGFGRGAARLLRGTTVVRDAGGAAIDDFATLPRGKR